MATKKATRATKRRTPAKPKTKAPKYVIVTDGSQGGEDPKQKDSDLAGIRQKEQRAAAKVLGVKKVEFLGYKDGHISHDLKLRRIGLNRLYPGRSLQRICRVDNKYPVTVTE